MIAIAVATFSDSSLLSCLIFILSPGSFIDIPFPSEPAIRTILSGSPIELVYAIDRLLFSSR